MNMNECTLDESKYLCDVRNCFDADMVTETGMTTVEFQHKAGNPMLTDNDKTLTWSVGQWQLVWKHEERNYWLYRSA